MAKEETTLEKLNGLLAEKDSHQLRADVAGKEARALAEGTCANIDGCCVRLLFDGSVHLVPDMNLTDKFILSERQFRGLLGWGLKHVGE